MAGSLHFPEEGRTASRCVFGADLSALPELEQAGARYFDADGHPVDAMEFLAKKGVSSVRIRLWLDPYDAAGRPYRGGTSDLSKYILLAKRAKALGLSVLLDLHYSDFWCDPARQCIPKAWQGLTLSGTAEKIRGYTAETLAKLKALDLMPEAVQVGNEITNGMLWPLGKLSWDADETAPAAALHRLFVLLSAGCSAVRAHSDAKIVIHLENSGNLPRWQYWFDAMTREGLDYDIIGASYYPYWHGTLDDLSANLRNCITRYGKPVWVVETAYPFTAAHFTEHPGAAALSISDPARLSDGRPAEYPVTRTGQAAFLSALSGRMAALGSPEPVRIYWWEPAWIPLRRTGLGAAQPEDLYPAGSWASVSALSYCHEEGRRLGNEWANQCMFDYDGKALPVTEVMKGEDGDGDEPV